jgi:hypothetical protein
MEKRGYTEKQAAAYIGMSRGFLSQDRMNGFRENRTQGPNYVKFGRNIRYLKEHLDAWLEKHIVEREAPEFINIDKL